MTPEMHQMADDLCKVIDTAKKLRDKLFSFDSDDMDFNVDEGSNVFVQFSGGPVFPIPERFKGEIVSACRDQHELRMSELIREAADFLKGRTA